MLANITNLSKQYKEQKAVNQISFEIEEGRCIALLGPNGAGKTTTLQMLAGLLAPTAGTITFNGSNERDYRHLIGFLPQHPSFFNWMTAEEFLVFSGKLSNVPRAALKSRVQEVLSFVDLEGLSNKKIGSFSGGMKQRLGLAQAVLHEPQLLILDEPVSALDPAGRRDVLLLIEELKQQMTILFSTHILHDAEQVCDQVLMLKAGQLRWNGTLEALKNQFASLVVKLQTKEPLHGALDNIEGIEAVDYLNPTTAMLSFSDKANTNHVLKSLLNQNLTIMQYVMQDSLEDAYMKVMNQ